MIKFNNNRDILGFIRQHRVLYLLKAILELDVMNVIDDKESVNIGQAAAKLSVEKDKLHRLLNSLSEFGVFEIQGDTVLHNSLSMSLKGSIGLDFLNIINFVIDERVRGSWQLLSKGLQSSEKSCFELNNHVTPYELMQKDNEFQNIFQNAMHSSFNLSKKRLLDIHVENAVIGDLGGGDGHLLLQLIEEYPGIRGFVAEIESVAKKNQTNNSSQKIEWLSKDLFKDPLPQADIFIFKRVLHNWSDHECRVALINSAKYLRKNGKIIIIDVVAQANPNLDFRQTVAIRDIEMLIMQNEGRERHLSEMVAIIESASLSIALLKQWDEIYTILEVKPI